MSAVPRVSGCQRQPGTWLYTVSQTKLIKSSLSVCITSGSCFTVPFQRLSTILGDSNPALKHPAQHILSLMVSQSCSLFEQFKSFFVVIIAYIVLISLFIRPNGFRIVQILIQVLKLFFRLLIALRSSLTVPFGSLSVILSDIGSVFIHPAKVKLAFAASE